MESVAIIILTVIVVILSIQLVNAKAPKARAKCPQCWKPAYCYKRELSLDETPKDVEPGYYDQYFLDCPHCGFKEKSLEYCGAPILAKHREPSTCPFCANAIPPLHQTPPQRLL